jgi:hypothetical protein
VFPFFYVQSMFFLKAINCMSDAVCLHDNDVCRRLTQFDIRAFKPGRGKTEQPVKRRA